MDNRISDLVFTESARILLTFGVPLLLAAVIAAAIIGAIQRFAGVQDATLGYAGRLCAVVAAGYLLMAALVEALSGLLQGVLR